MDEVINHKTENLDFSDDTAMINADLKETPLVDGELSDSEIDTCSILSDERSVVFLNTVENHADFCVYGVTFLGRQHQIRNEVCQDYHLFSDLGDNWHLYIVSDGAGSAKASHRGAKINCEVTAHLLQQLIDKLGWKHQEELPTKVEWQMQFMAVCRTVRNFIEEKVESLEEELAPRDFNATILVLLVTPLGLLCGHIGDGRMGYKNASGEWLSLITPHRGEEVNQTVFLTNPWDKTRFPAFKMSGVFVPETRIVKEVPSAICLLSDGCENFSWNCLQMDSETGIYRDVNTPFDNFWEPLFRGLSDNTRNNKNVYFIDKIDIGNRACQIEDDDRSLIIGIYNQFQRSYEIDNTNE